MEDGGDGIIDFEALIMALDETDGEHRHTKT